MELLRRGSYDDLLELHRRYWSGTKDDAVVEEGLFDIYETSIDEVWAEAKNPALPTCLPVGRCNAPLLKEGENELGWSCSGLDQYILDANLGSAVGLTAGPEAVNLYSCANEERRYTPREVSLTRDWETPWLAIERIMQTPEVPHLVTLTTAPDNLEALVHLRKLPSAFLDKCPNEAEEALEWSFAPVMQFIVPSQAGRFWFKVATPEDSTFTVRWTDAWSDNLEGPDRGAQAWLCGDCGSDPIHDCIEVSATEAELVTAEGEEVFLVLDSLGDPAIGLLLEVKRTLK